MDNTNKTILFEEAYNAYMQEIFRYSHFRVGEEEVAKDITASTFLKFWQRLLRSEEAIENTRALLYFIARALVIDHYRMQARRPSISIDLVEEAQLIDSYNLVESLDTKSAYETVLQAIHRLKETYQEVILLHYIEGLSIIEVSEILKETENNARVRLHRALVELRIELKHERQ